MIRARTKPSAIASPRALPVLVARFALAALLVLVLVIVLGTGLARAAPNALEEARRAARQEQWVQAAQRYADVLKVDPAHREAALGLAHACGQSGRTDRLPLAEEALRTLLAADGDDVEVRLALARVFLARAPTERDARLAAAMVDRAQAHFGALIEAHPALQAAAVGLAQALRVEGDDEGALAVLDAYLDRRPKDAARALYWKGRTLYEMGRTAHAAAGHAYPLSAEVRRLFARAQGASLSSSAADPTAFDTWMQVAWTSQVLGDRETALEGYERAHEIRPEDPLPWRGVKVLFTHDASTLARVLLRWGGQEPEERRAKLVQAFDALERGDSEEAGRLLEAYLEEAGEDADGLYWLGKVRERQSREAAAVDLFERAVRADPDHLAAVEEIDRRMRRTALVRAKESLEGLREVHANYAHLMELAPRNPFVGNNAGFVLREAWKAHEDDTSWREALLLSARAYEAAAGIIGEWDPEKARSLPWARRYAYAQIVCDTAVVFHLFAPIRDLGRAELYYSRSLEFSEDGYVDAWTYLRKIYEEQERWDDLHALAARCADGLRNEAGEPLTAQREAAAAVCTALEADGRVTPR